jgi:uncharacterized circularly permuted ATP-grasp superfamily protein
VRDSKSGEFVVLEDNVRTPSGGLVRAREPARHAARLSGLAQSHAVRPGAPLSRPELLQILHGRRRPRRRARGRSSC